MINVEYKNYVRAISTLIPEERIFTDTLHRLAYGTDGGFYRLEPQVVVRVSNEKEMQLCLREASSRKLPVTFKAAGTSLSGQTISDSILLMANEGWEDYEVLDEGQKIRLQPGIIGAKVNRILAPYDRKFGPDPASINSAMVGGIIINNASGMNCGTHENAYQTIESAKIIFADGTLLDTADADSRESFRRTRPGFVEKIEEIRDRVRADETFAARIRKKYSIKNTTGFSINPFIDYDDPFHIIINLMIGSEGALAFISEVVMRSVPMYRCKASSMVYFPDIMTACKATVALKKGPVDGAELLDRLALKSVENKEGIPDFIKNFDETTTAVLMETMASDQDILAQNIVQIKEILNDFETLRPVEFTSDPVENEQLWNIRKGVFPAVGGMREIGTTCLIEDVAYHMETLPEATKELQDIIAEHGYTDAVIYGHALEGNFHFIINQDFSDPKEVERYDAMMHAVINMTVDKYDGSLKAEHGTGRNMAPFVKKEWGEKGYDLMREIKKLFDPDTILNPGVIINDDPKCYLKNFKPLPQCDPLIDKCIECGFCEVNCMSNHFSLSARQRIVVQREIARLKKTGENPERLTELEKGFIFAGDESCAGDGLCETSCPVSIDTGKYIKQIRAANRSKFGKKIGRFTGEHLDLVCSSASVALRLLGGMHRLLGTKNFGKICDTARSVSGNRIPLWTPAMPSGVSAPQKTPINFHAAQKVVYFPSCITRSMGPAKDDPVNGSVTEVTIRVLKKAGYGVIFPEGMKNLCCGTPWESKGFVETADMKSSELEQALLIASEQGKYPVLCDTSPCLYRMRNVMDSKLKLYEPVEFAHKFLLNKLHFTPKKQTIAIHPTCSTQKMGLSELLREVASMCADKVVLPPDVNCCGFAGDKGFHLPDLNAHGLRKAVPVIEQEGAVVGYSNSRTCEIGCTSQIGIPYMSIMYIIDEVTTGVD
ncbi:FAD-binding and (Fe-S)-binding domain-containing protein [uncultured Desulfobacter sp.]|uniref:FAD-binding and (Fe-S)-binding domain-containing protein n=1 Tax=uncultured Desulfobacter sp. TaxID=240139 RepID=UPI0029C6C85A|nr:FAD-binding and (Fe-S)-binding domain-containing protein [uncultured Desulfobacter sp.]